MKCCCATDLNPTFGLLSSLEFVPGVCVFLLQFCDRCLVAIPRFLVQWMICFRTVCNFARQYLNLMAYWRAWLTNVKRVRVESVFWVTLGKVILLGMNFEVLLQGGYNLIFCGR